MEAFEKENVFVGGGIIRSAIGRNVNSAFPESIREHWS